MKLIKTVASTRRNGPHQKECTTPSREIPIAFAFEVVADLHKRVLSCEISIPAFLRTIFTQPARVGFLIPLWGFKWLSNSWLWSFSRHKVDLFRYSSRHVTIIHESLSWGYARSSRDRGAFSFIQLFVNFVWWNSLHHVTYIHIANLVALVCRSEKQQAC